jgi:GNAT superfamily N-acetyltransferase
VAEVRLGQLRREHRARLSSILVSTGAFSTDEIGVALELFDAVIPSEVEESALPQFDAGADYEFVGAFVNDDLIGYACFGPTPATDGTYDLYWLAVDSAAQGRGAGRALVRWVEQELGRRGARLLVVETSSRADYEDTRSFYMRSGYVEAARVKDFYAPSDDRIIFTTRFTTRERGVATR